MAKTTTKKKTKKATTARRTAKAAVTVTPEERYRMIQEAAYFLAEKEGFSGDCWKHWLTAEAEIDARLAKR